ncbi:ankyrin repeat domain-containing protein 44 [Fusarium sporotrichioides]|uniref:Ankyrin repeat domain-containing protein 44 n=1 Tax=Fusarium sporotrichioides TaxID=5514 RepID=A0A395RE54_FUSSP|nr:ankyrin repeat domain-containing protein 44 [Fusarium sporotrichioides]
MAEAIGLVASVASLLDLALKLSNALHDLQFQIRKAPDLIQSLENETEAIRLVLTHVESTTRTTAAAQLGNSDSAAIISDLEVELGKSEAVLKQLGSFIDSLKNETPALQRFKWARDRAKGTELRSKLKESRIRIGELQLAYSNSSLTRMELVLQDIQLIQHRQHVITSSLGACVSDTRNQVIAHHNTAIRNQADIITAVEALQTTIPRLPPDWLESISNQLATAISNVHPRIPEGPPPTVAERQSALNRMDPGGQCLFEAQGGNTAVSRHRTHQEESFAVIPSPLRHSTLVIKLKHAIPLKLHSEVEGLIQVSQCLEDLELSFIHKIVVKRCPIDLAPVLKTGRADIVSQINAQDRFGMTPLMYAVVLGDTKAVDVLIKAGASVHKTTPFGHTMLYYASSLPPSACAALLDLFLAAGANAHATFPSGWSVLHSAAIYDNTTMMHRMIQEGNSEKVVRLLHDKGVDLNVLADNGLSPLGVAIQANAPDTQLALLELGANYLLTGDWGTIFHLAAYWSNEVTFRTLSSVKLQGLDIHARNAKGLTATSLFEDRYDMTDQLAIAFHQLKDSIRSQSLEEHKGEDEVGDDDIFFDAFEV